MGHGPKAASSRPSSGTFLTGSVDDGWPSCRWAVATAIYMHEIRVERFETGQKRLRLAIQNLAGEWPAIVFGLFGLGFFYRIHSGRGIDKRFCTVGELNYGQPAIIWAALTMALLDVCRPWWVASEGGLARDSAGRIVKWRIRWARPQVAK